MRALPCVIVLLVAMPGFGADEQSVTFYKNVAPILQAHCQTCHRPGQAGPMSFLTFESTRPWAKAIKAAVLSHKMPPWFADPDAGHFLNDPTLAGADIKVLAKWVDDGAPPGDPKQAPAAVKWPEGWQIQPDVIVEGPTTEIPAHPKNNVIDWITMTIPSGFSRDTWVTSIEIKPEHPEVTHHVCIGINPHQPDAQYFVPLWKPKPRDEEGSALPDTGLTFDGGGGRTPGVSTVQDCYLPGNVVNDFRPLHAAKLIPAGSDFGMSIHYTPNGTTVIDHVRIGFTTAKQPPQRRYVSFSKDVNKDPKVFAIPPRAANWQSPPYEGTFEQDVELVLMIPHMHARGKDMTYTLQYPDGRHETILSIPHYDFNWQIGYHTSISVPKGTKLRVDAHFDNSRNNPANPNPDRTVYYGEMTWEEMMNPFLSVVTDPHVDPKTILSDSK